MVGLLSGAWLANSTLFLISFLASAVAVWALLQYQFPNSEPPFTITWNPSPSLYQVCQSFVTIPPSQFFFNRERVVLPTEVVLSSFDGAGKCQPFRDSRGRWAFEKPSLWVSRLGSTGS